MTVPDDKYSQWWEWDHFSKPRVHYWRMGEANSGPPVLLLHGFGVGEVWQRPLLCLCFHRFSMTSVRSWQTRVAVNQLQIGPHCFTSGLSSGAQLRSCSASCSASWLSRYPSSLLDAGASLPLYRLFSLGAVHAEFG